MRKIVCSTITILMLITLFALPAFGYGGGGDGDNLGSSATDLGSGNQPPAGFSSIPFDNTLVTEQPHDTTSTDRTAITGEPETLSPEELQQLQAAFDFIMITTGGVILGYSTAAAGWSVLGQAAASGAYAGLTTYATSDDKVADNTTKAALQDFIIGFIPVSPIGQAAISQAVTKLREVLPEPKFNREGASLSELRRAYRGF